MQAALERAHQVYAQFPAAFASVSALDPADYERWILRTPDEWVDPATLPRNEKGQVNVGRRAAIPIWRYTTPILARAREESSTPAHSSSGSAS